MTDSAILQDVKRSFQVISLFFNFSIISRVINALLSRTRNTGRVNRPPSLHIRISINL